MYNFRERDGYYTLEQVEEAFKYLEISDPTDDKYHYNYFRDHVKRILDMMKKHHMDIIIARDVIQYDSWFEVMVNTYGIKPIPFKSEKRTYTEHTVTAPNFRNAEFCGNCKYFYDQTDQDDMLNGVCDIYNEVDEDYDPPLTRPMYLSCYGVCNSFKMRED